jgi:hypothetical protein
VTEALLKSYSEALAEWSRLAMNHLTAYRAKDHKAAWILLLEAEEARTKTEQARTDLRGHVAKHGC